MKDNDMEEKQGRRGIIVPYGLSFGGAVIGDMANNFIGMPLYLPEETEEVDEL